MSDTVWIIILGVISAFLGIGWWRSARAGRLMSQISLAQIKGMEYTITGRDPDDPDGDAERSW